jgi:hypothetical protein
LIAYRLIPGIIAFGGELARLSRRNDHLALPFH